jgi:3-oxoacyl-ACP reductase-like protein
MSIFGNIMSAIFGHSSSQTSAAPAAAAAATGAAAAQSAPAAAPAGAPVDVTAIMDNLASQATQKLDWRSSIVDLMKLINLDSSLAARKELAQELNYTGDVNDSASMNIWLHKQVMIKLAENGGKVPDELKH